ncbi:SGNH/GDSL hydrolase family protein [Stieleria sp. JC731]|uniref:SGNH/GDSL hydrolase family protein n=1 Tax=Stieleria sp. JC731 TaxID=2894195 RepID=UPI001E59A421|nr:SGNH/GDSL hydrolase family protein [Stieleria sp. JC731]MCC9602552.1 SGNH/GDSL hydrolase family protein [Stieleria sp. JC731]
MSVFAQVVVLLSALLFHPAVAADDSTSTNVDPKTSASSIQVRGGLASSLAAFQSGEGTVAFMGGSITEMEGYRPMVIESIKERFPSTEFDFINAGISSTCSHTGAFRFKQDVLAKEPDLLLVEFAVNDDQDASHSYQDAVRGMEGIVRAARQSRPQMDIVMVFFVNESMLKTVQSGKVPVSIAAHLSVAERYGVSTCNVAVELARLIEQGKMTWLEYGGVHPKRPGNRVAADLVDQVFERCEFREGSKPKSADQGPSESANLPSALDPFSFAKGDFLPRENVNVSDDWQWKQPDWDSIGGGFRSRFAGRELCVAESPSSECEIAFHGNAFGLYVLAGPDAGVVEYSVDGGVWEKQDLYHRFSRGLHYPRTVVLKSELSDGDHKVRLRVSREKNPESNGHAVRVLEFVAS